MQAAQLYGPSDIRIQEVELPPIGPKDVLLKIKKVGICGTDIHIYKGHVPSLKSLIMGHEFVGDIVKIGKDVGGLEVGNKAVAEHVIGCGKCVSCQKGKINLCNNRGAIGINLPGALAEYLIIPSHLVYKLPENLSYDEGVLVEPLSIAVYAARKVKIKKGDTVAVVGQGPIGLLIDSVAKAKEAKVLGIDIEDSRLQFAQKKSYIDIPYNSKDVLNVSIIEKLTGRDGVDIAFEAVGREETLNLALDIAARRGKVVVLGIFGKRVALDMMKVVKKELEVIGSWTCLDTFAEAIELLEKKKINLDGFITHRYPLAKVKEAFDDTINHPQDRIKTIIEIA